MKHGVIERAEKYKNDFIQMDKVKSKGKMYLKHQVIIDALLNGDLDNDLHLVSGKTLLGKVEETIEAALWYTCVPEFRVELEGISFTSAFNVKETLIKGNKNRVRRTFCLLCNIIPKDSMSVLRAELHQAIDILEKREDTFFVTSPLTVNEIIANRDMLINKAINESYSN